MCSDICTKNVGGPDFKKHSQVYVSDDWGICICVHALFEFYLFVAYVL